MTDKTASERLQKALEYFTNGVNVSGGQVFFDTEVYETIIAALQQDSLSELIGRVPKDIHWGLYTLKGGFGCSIYNPEKVSTAEGKTPAETIRAALEQGEKK